MKKIAIFICLFIYALNVNAQYFDDLFTTYTPVNTPSRPIYVTPLPSIIDNSVTVIDNSYRSYTPSVTCTDSQKQSGQILMLDNSTNKDEIVDAEVLFKSFSNNTASITITRLKLDGKWYPMNIDAIRLSSLLDSSRGSDRNTLLELMKNFNFIASSEDVIFLF